MTRNLKALGLTLVAALALSAVAAQAASAATDTIKSGSKSGTTFLTAEAASGEAGDQVVETTTGEHKSIICGKINFKTSFSGSSVSEFTAEPVYSECWWWKTKEGGTTTKTADTEKLSSAFFNTQGCHFNFATETTKGNLTGGEHALLKIKNKENCEHLSTTVTALKIPCFEVPTEQQSHGIRYENLGTSPETLKVKITAHGLESTTVNSTACPTKSGENETHNNTSYVGDLVLKAYSNAAHTEQVNLTVE
jgi:hypothetical protein